ncbi:MAG: tRNA (N6-isopentenyl adenosine(37)-C2)-methylthiotransferase MiaB [Magnetococcus sp. WYHC-3]
MKRLLIKNFGCQMNAYDAGRMADLLAASHGYSPTDRPDDADLIILNTCHVREKAEEKLFSELGRLRKETGERPVIFAVGGCVGQAEGAAIFRRAPFVDVVFGPQNYHRLPTLLERLAAGERRVLDDSTPQDSKFDSLPEVVSTGPLASVTVQEGCDRFCTYCVVPHTRGREWSRSVAEVLAEVRSVVSRGARDILLLGQNVNAYRGVGADACDYDLPLLIREVALIPGVERIRFVTSHPADMTQELVEVFGDVPQLCPYLHLPIQSGSDRILAAMERGHRVVDYLDWIRRLRAVRPDIALASDFIVGFPGETDADFQQTLELVDQVRYDHAYSFKFSPRPGTPAADMPHQVPPAVATERLERLQMRINAHQLAGNRAKIGSVQPVLVEGWSSHRPQQWSGRTPCQRKVNFSGGADLTGRTVMVRITEGLPNSLRGELLPPARE